MEIYTESNDDMGLTNEVCDLSASNTFYGVASPRCPTNRASVRSSIAAVLVHYVQNQPDRVTFCGWFINQAMADDAINELWTTEQSINGLRQQASRYNMGDGSFDMTRWRNQRQLTLERSRGLPDIDVSVGFDTFLTIVVGILSRPWTWD